MQHRIVRNFDRPSPQEQDALRGFSVLSLSGPTTFGTELLIDSLIRPLRPGMRLFGPAVTVTLPEPSVLIPSYATTLCQPGDVLVIDAKGRRDVGSFGFSMALSAMNMRCNGVLIDGSVVDVEWLCGRMPIAAEEEAKRGGLIPVFARGAVGSWAPWDTAGSINVPVTIGGITVRPGDLVIGDDDGIVVVPGARFDEAVRLVTAFRDMARNSDYLTRVREGGLWFDVLPMKERLAELAIPEYDRPPCREDPA